MHTAHKVVIFVINDIQGFVTHINESTLLTDKDIGISVSEESKDKEFSRKYNKKPQKST